MNPLHPTRRQLIAAAALATLAPASFAQSDFPSKSLRLVVPFPAGGAGDTMARIIATPLAQALGQSVVVDNKPGADGLLGANEVARSAPDGYTLLMATASPIVYVPSVHITKPPYDPIRDFAPVTHFTSFTYVFAVHESVPAKTMEEFIAYVRKNPGKVSYGTGDATSILTMAQFAQAAKLDMVHIPYKGGAAATTDLMAGRVHAMILTPADVDKFQGKLTPLVVLLPKRSPIVPNVPTFAELGMPQVNVLPWSGIFVAGKTPRAIVDKLSQELNAVFKRPELVAQFRKFGMGLEGSTPEALAEIVKTQLAVWREGVKLAKIPTD